MRRLRRGPASRWPLHVRRARRTEGIPPAPGMPGTPPGIPPGMPPPDWFVNCFIICCIIIDCMSCFFAPKSYRRVAAAPLPPTSTPAHPIQTSSPALAAVRESLLLPRSAAHRRVHRRRYRNAGARGAISRYAPAPRRRGRTLRRRPRHRARAPCAAFTPRVLTAHFAAIGVVIAIIVLALFVRVDPKMSTSPPRLLSRSTRARPSNHRESPGRHLAFALARLASVASIHRTSGVGVDGDVRRRGDVEVSVRGVHVGTRRLMTQETITVRESVWSSPAAAPVARIRSSRREKRACECARVRWDIDSVPRRFARARHAARHAEFARERRPGGGIDSSGLSSASGAHGDGATRANEGVRGARGGGRGDDKRAEGVDDQAAVETVGCSAGNYRGRRRRSHQRQVQDGWAEMNRRPSRKRRRLCCRRCHRTLCWTLSSR